MNTRKLLWFMALAFSLVLLVPYLESPYGYVMSTFLSIGKSEVESSSSISTSGNESDSVAMDEKKSKNRKNSTDSLSIDDSVVQHSATDSLETNHPRNETNHPRNESSAAEREIELGHSLPVSSYASVRNPSAERFQGPTAAPSSIPEYNGSNKSTALTEVNSSAIKRIPNLKRFKGAPSVVVPISKMNDLLSQSRASYHFTKARWPSQADKELLDAKKLIETAYSVKKNNVYRNFSAFTRSYELMEKTLKIYVYSEGERPIFHEPKLDGIYASEGWFMKQLQESKHFVTKNGDKAHLFYLPFSLFILKEVLYVPNSHSKVNLVRYLSSYLKNITTTHRFWDRIDGADHFLVACHDWAPSETGQIMSNCIRSLCNANIKSFNFSKDVSLPVTYIHTNATTPLKLPGGKPPSQRKILAFFAGQMHGYLRPILLDYWENKDPDIKITGKLGKLKEYVHYMKSSKYCISARGYEPDTPRVVEAIFYDCVPVILSDNYIPPFFETLNWESFAVFIPEEDIPSLKKILTSIPEKRYVEMQKRVKMVQKHFVWHEKAVKFDIFHMILHSVWYTRVLHSGS